MLASGSRLGVYEVVDSLGAGGMGEVYRARDTVLKRDVALKVLPEAFGRDAERLARFEREARTLASLNHPHIAQIHGLEVTDLVRAIVMELVEGETLATRLARGAIPLAEALPNARQIAEALEAAHEHGIVHRGCRTSARPGSNSTMPRPDIRPSRLRVKPERWRVGRHGRAPPLAPSSPRWR